VPEAAPLTALQIGMTASPQRRGGLDRYFFGLLRAFAPLGVETRGLVVGNPADVAAQGIDGVEAYARDGASLLARWSALRGAVNRRLPGCDLVVSHFAPYAFPVLDRIRSHPTVVHFHGSWARESEADGARGLTLAAKLALERLVYRGGARFVVLTNAVAQKLQRDFNVPPELIRVVPGGVDIGRFQVSGTRADARRGLGLPLDRPTILTACRLIRAKGIAALIDAVALMRERIPDVLLVVAGTGPMAAELQLTVRERGLENAVRFTGFFDDHDLLQAYRAADLLVVPTIAIESFGLVVIEAMACGTPAMVTPVDGLPETVSDLDPALIFRGTAPQDLAEGMLAALDGTLALPNPAVCRAYAERFDWPHIAARVRRVYEEVA
jgi:glycosyltransferase involved in cell wall biosynthesis